MSTTALRGSTRLTVVRMRFRQSRPVEPVAQPRYGDVALLAAAVGDVPLHLVTSLVTAADPDRDGGRNDGEREDQDDSRTLDGRA